MLDELDVAAASDKDSQSLTGRSRRAHSRQNRADARKRALFRGLPPDLAPAEARGIGADTMAGRSAGLLAGLIELLVTKEVRSTSGSLAHKGLFRMRTTS
jgi:hypothetical protein